MLHRRLRGLFVVAYAAPATLAAQVEREPPRPMPIPRSIEELRSEMQRVVDSSGVPGVGFAVFTRDSLLYAGGVGLADVAAKVPVGADTHFRVGSISKSFVAVAMLMLQRAGRVDLDAPVRSIVPEIEFDNRWEATDPVRVAHLLEHTTGFDDMRFNSMYNVREPADLPLREVMQRARKSMVTRWRPGERFAYSNPGYGLAGYIIEKVSGVPYDRFIRDSILYPLGMMTSAFTLSDTSTPALARGYNQPDDPPIGYPPIYLRPAGDLHASPRELTRFVQLLMRRGDAGDGRRLLDSASVDRMERTETTLAAQRGMHLGYGLGNYVALDLPIVMHGHDGGIDGFISSYRYSSDANVGVIALLNSDASEERLLTVQRLLVLYALGDSTRRAPPEHPVTAATLARYTGHYAEAAPRNQLFSLAGFLFGRSTVTARGDSLFIASFGDTAVRLVPVSDSTFRRTDETGPTIAFVHDPNGAIVLTGTRYFERARSWPRTLALAGLIAAAVLCASAVLAALVWIPRALLRKSRNPAANRLRILLLAAIGTAVVFMALLVTAEWRSFGVVSAQTIEIFILSVAAPALAIVALASALRAPRASVGTAVKVHSVLVALAVFGFALVMIASGLAGLRTWAY